MERLDLNGIEELKRRAKMLYFDVHKNLDKIFVDSYGRFADNATTLIEQNKHEYDIKVYTLTRKDCEKSLTIEKK